jgi:hypothetical protein
MDEERARALLNEERPWARVAPPTSVDPTTTVSPPLTRIRDLADGADRRTLEETDEEVAQQLTARCRGRGWPPRAGQQRFAQGRRAAGGALQNAQRIGAAIGTALLASFFYRVLTGSGHAYSKAVSDALLCACGLMLLASCWRSPSSGTAATTAATSRRPPHNPNTTISTSPNRCAAVG